MKYYILFKIFMRSLVLVIYLCTFNRRLHFVNSNDEPMETSMNYNSEKPKLYRMKESAHYYYSKPKSSDQSISFRDGEQYSEPERYISTNYANKKSKTKARTANKKTNARTDKKKNKISARVPQVWNAAEFGKNEPKPWIKDDKDSLSDNAKAEEAVSTRKLNSRNPSINVGSDSVESVPNDLSAPGCGQAITMVIVNGKQAAEGAYPWIALIMRKGRAFCAGSIINENWVLSAGHCFMTDTNAETLNIRVGTNNRESGTDYKVDKVIVHERFNNDNMLNSDISLMKIKRPIKMSRLVKPVCMPSHTYEEPKSKNLMVVGWGVQKWHGTTMPIYLQEVSLNIIPTEQCSQKYEKKKFNIYRSQICTWNKDQDACQGDSGGPAIEYLKGRGTLVGIVSFGATCADEYPAIFTKVSYFINWIQTNMDNNNK